MLNLPILYLSRLLLWVQYFLAGIYATSLDTIRLIHEIKIAKLNCRLMTQ